MHQWFLMKKWTQKEEGQHGAAVYCDSDRRNPWREGIGPPVLGGRLELRICRNEQGHRYYTGNDITLLANIKELKKRGLALRAIKELVPRISRTAPGTTASKVKLLEDEQPEREKILEFQKIMERLIAQELHMKKEGEDQCRDLDETIRNRQLARKEAAAALEKRSRRIRRKHL